MFRRERALWLFSQCIRCPAVVLGRLSTTDLKRSDWIFECGGGNAGPSDWGYQYGMSDRVGSTTDTDNPPPSGHELAVWADCFWRIRFRKHQGV
ncbi:hypothetical protein B0H66DRAFT_40654 [Apodospora peruviana]|uniref:Uncharacterized protein n=1 Tax=Apodospora peruviana TaxID=516989 RepID=A0AAE0IRV5_9PEZI|nr:hypothetical protein B0H66DRAFT_40654 [Apodospora peruviana]